MEIRRVKQLLEAFRSMHILVIGDVMLDEFIWGKVSRISPEAPVPVVEVTGESFYPGGAANVGRNLKEFCRKASVLGLVGTDRHGKQLTKIMGQMGLSMGCLLEEPSYQTIVKTRIVARQQQMVRVDREVLMQPDAELVERGLRRLEDVLPNVDAVIFEDYAKGLLAQEFVERATKMIRNKGKVVTADPNPKNPLAWSGLTAIKPNRSEAFRCAGIEENDAGEDFTEQSRLPEVSRRLLEKWKTQYLLITLGEHGMMLFERDQEPFHIPTRAQEVYDVSGAGDTAIALFTLALAAGATAREAAEISNHASSVVVGKLGTATLTPEELLASFERYLPREIDLAVLESEPIFDTVSKKKFRSLINKPLRKKEIKVAQPAVFLDRDGTLMEEVDYCRRPEDVRVFSGVANHLYRLKQAGYLLIVVTNQAGIGRGYFTEKDYRKVDQEFTRQIGPRLLDFTYFCPDHPDQATQCRKPGIGMILQAQTDFNIDLQLSWLIGDKASDIECGKNAGLKTILVSTGYGKNEICQPDFRAKDFGSAVDCIIVA